MENTELSLDSLFQQLMAEKKFIMGFSKATVKSYYGSRGVFEKP
jgi:hypothetical protein